MTRRIAFTLLLLATTRVTGAAQAAADSAATSFAAIWKAQCGARAVPRADSGLVYGYVLRTQDVPYDTSEFVQGSWSADTGSIDDALLRSTISRAHVRPDGTYALCGIPAPHSLMLFGAQRSIASPMVAAHLEADRVARRDFALATSRALIARDTASAVRNAESGSRAVIAGTVLDENRRRIAGAVVRIIGFPLSATTDASGRFEIEGVPVGERQLEVKAGSVEPLRVLANLYAGDTVTLTARLAATTSITEGAKHDTSSIIHGVVTDSAKHPLANIEVYVMSSGRHTRTDAAGRYSIERMIEGPTQLRARRLGWLPADTTVVLMPHSNVAMNLRFTGRATSLDTIRITASFDDCKPRDFEGFTCRQKSGRGVFLDADRVDALNPRYIADLFDGVPGLTRDGTRVKATSGWRCIQYLYNGHRPMPIEGMGLRAMDARDIVAVEFYADHNDAPEWYKVFAGNCSLIVLWTEGPTSPQ